METRENIGNSMGSDDLVTIDLEARDEEDAIILNSDMDFQLSYSWKDKWLIPNTFGFLSMAGINYGCSFIPGLNDSMPNPVLDNLRAVIGLKSIKTIRSLLHEEENFKVSLGMRIFLAIGAGALVGNTYRVILNQVGYTPEDADAGNGLVAAANALVQSVGTTIVSDGLEKAYPYLKSRFFALKEKLSKPKEEELNTTVFMSLRD